MGFVWTRTRNGGATPTLLGFNSIRGLFSEVQQQAVSHDFDRMRTFPLQYLVPGETV